MDEVKEKLRKQLELLAERSQELPESYGHTLAEMSNAMCQIANLLMNMKMFADSTQQESE